MARYKEVEKGQGLLLPVVLSEQLVSGTFEYALNELLDSKIDLSIFDDRYNNDLTGAKAIEPVKVLSSETEPHYTTISNFVSGMGNEIEKMVKINKIKGLTIKKYEVIIIAMDINVPLIVSLAAPEQIILFGSYARGDNNEKSDIDLLIIKKDLKNEREVNNKLYMAFFENKINIPIDLISVDYDKYNENNGKIGYIYKTIKEQGKIIYGTL